MQLTSAFKAFLLRLGIFLAFFLLLTGIVGPWVVRSKLLYGFDFFIYGNMGKLLIFSIITFFVFARDNIQKITLHRYNPKNVVFVFLSFILVPVFFSLGSMLLTYPNPQANLPLFFASHVTLILLTIFPLPGVFGLKFLIYFARTFIKEILLCVGISIPLYLMIFEVWKLWSYLSDIVLAVASKLFSFVFPIVRTGYGKKILVQNFAVAIDEACSGIEGIFLFTSLYVIIAVAEWKKFNKKKLIFMFLPALVGLFFTNIARVMFLILIGVYISPTLALTLFHTYAGLMLFVIYFILFWYFLYRWMRR